MQSRDSRQEEEPFARSSAYNNPYDGSGNYNYGDGARGASEKVYVDEIEIVVRMGFVRKVFSILAVQLAVTFGAILLSSYNKSINNYLAAPEKSQWMLSVALVGLIGTSFVIACCENLTRSHPHNLVILGIYTLSESVLLSFITIAYELEFILFTVFVTFVVVTGLAIFAKTTSIDFTSYGLYLYVFLLALLLLGFVAMIWPTDGIQLVYALLGTLLFSFYVIYDIQLIIVGKHQLKFSVDDYVMASLMLYIDVIQMFLFLLRLLGDNRN